MNKRTFAIFLFTALVFIAVSCSNPSTHVVEIKKFPVDIMEGIITQSGVEIDKAVSSDGNGALKITATEPTVVRLFEVGDVDIENAKLIYQAKVRTEGVEEQVYLEMWCHFPGKGEFFSRGLRGPLTGTTNWVTEKTPVFFYKREKIQTM